MGSCLLHIPQQAGASPWRQAPWIPGPTAVCPPRIRLNCLLQRRKGCGPGGIRTCGPCIRPYHEDPGGDCVLETPHKNGDGANSDAGPSDLATLIRSLVANKQKGSRTPGTKTPEHAGSMRIDPQVPSVTETPPTSPPPPTARPSPLTPGSSAPWLEEDLNSGPPTSRLNEAVSVLLVLMCSVTGVSGLLVAALCWYRLQREVRLAQKLAYTAYRGNHYRYHQPRMYMDARLAQSCQVHQYQRQKKILTNEESPPKPIQQLSTESETENRDFTVVGRWKSTTRSSTRRPPGSAAPPNPAPPPFSPPPRRSMASPGGDTGGQVDLLRFWQHLPQELAPPSPERLGVGGG
ncbi:neural proliferation differentiation and control protein 1-like isoform X2 [Gopherus evgoodei]|uniref:neural proliferation differentiation and control protein 1-like isoform X2 n=1 Tax=Gopherus evgoodei TaxID=1825980 RepID=UPI0011CF5C5D|nr:neural proliferation differentiation and control protein 1-like isoform X2 [Gopherus evgoodei]